MLNQLTSFMQQGFVCLQAQLRMLVLPDGNLQHYVSHRLDESQAELLHCLLPSACRTCLKRTWVEGCWLNAPALKCHHRDKLALIILCKKHTTEEHHCPSTATAAGLAKALIWYISALH
jgi:hypothetical protein